MPPLCDERLMTLQLCALGQAGLRLILRQSPTQFFGRLSSTPPALRGPNRVPTASNTRRGLQLSAAMTTSMFIHLAAPGASPSHTECARHAIAMCMPRVPRGPCHCPTQLQDPVGDPDDGYVLGDDAFQCPSPSATRELCRRRRHSRLPRMRRRRRTWRPRVFGRQPRARCPPPTTVFRGVAQPLQPWQHSSGPMGRRSSTARSGSNR